MLVPDTVPRRASEPFTGQVDLRVESTLTTHPIRRSYRGGSARPPAASTNQHPARDRDVIYTSRGPSFQLRSSIRRQNVDPRDGVTSELGHEHEPRDRAIQHNGTFRYASQHRDAVTTERRSRYNQQSNGDDGIPGVRSQSVRSEVDNESRWVRGERQHAYQYPIPVTDLPFHFFLSFFLPLLSLLFIHLETNFSLDFEQLFLISQKYVYMSVVSCDDIQLQKTAETQAVSQTNSGKALNGYGVAISMILIRQIHSVRGSLPRHALLSLVHALVVSKVDYCNSVLAGVTGNLLYRLQSVLNAAARLVFSARKFDRITSLLRELHWLKVPERIQYRLCVLAYRCLHNTAPSYLSESLQLAADVDGRRRLRSASSMMLVVPATRGSTLGDRAFSVAAAQSWNALPLDVKATPSLAAFRRRLKLPLFHASFPDDW